MKVLVDEIWWNVEDGTDITALPLSAIVTISDEIEDQEDFWHACEEVLEQRYNISPNGFRYSFIEETLQ